MTAGPPEASRRIIFVGGVWGRTGTTVMKRLLCGHPDVSPVSGRETHVIEKLSDLWPMLLADVGYSPEGAVTALARFTSHVRTTLGDTPELRDALAQLERSLGVRYMRLPGKWPRLPLPAPQQERPLAAALGTFVRQAFSAAALDPSLPVLCEKTPGNALHVLRLRRVLPEARMVVMLRDPLAVALSCTEQAWGPTDPLEAASYTAAFFRRWRRLAVDDERYLVVRYEELVAEPARVFPAVLGHLRLRPVAAVVHRACEELRAGADRSARLPRSQREALAARLGDERRHFGYADVAPSP